MDKKLNYEIVFDTLVKKTQEYIESNHLKAMILGISGGIDSTVVAAICHEVNKPAFLSLEEVFLLRIRMMSLVRLN